MKPPIAATGVGPSAWQAHTTAPTAPEIVARAVATVPTVRKIVAAKINRSFDIS
jgi:hypothetical protein